MSRLHIRRILLALCLAPTALSSLHPECELIFQLKREELSCLQDVAEQANRSTEGCQPFWDAVVCWPHAVVGETVQRACPAIFSLFKNNTDGAVILCHSEADIHRRVQHLSGSAGCRCAHPVALQEAALCQELHPHPALHHIHPEGCRCVHKGCDAVLKRGHEPLHPFHSVPVLFILIWIGSRVYFEDTECWDINEDSPYWWIIKGPIGVSIAVNFMLLINIIRILMQKLNPRLIQFNNSSQYRRLTKSTLLLIPLFGTHYMFFNFLPDYFSVNLRLCIELCMGSFQGLLVAILYCFLNQEVQTEVHMQWLRWQERSYGVVSPAAKGSQMDTPF
ncbi:growth hormone releasing hormone receptor, like isoform X3 [Acanthopagrus latus]|uniref:growth hormone releasing hormone receptor, like isoform X3 n=1 Tax=Acanthopagrus latus TaxID=8177 RepID=UPI00187CADEF|nr:growth hormone releasing hormone receptor, like isoform X3 [Acanthopagrus latus]WQY91217.1 GH-releasing hormone receptor-like isoform X3 [Acanthopagrus latus]